MHKGVFLSKSTLPKNLDTLSFIWDLFAQLYKYQTTNPSKTYKILDNFCKELTKINDAM